MLQVLSRLILVFLGLLVPPMIVAADPVESEIEAPGPDGPLKGLMLSPGAEDAPIVLIIPGSGPTNRDGNSLHGLDTDTYKLLAQGLAARGMASVRIDKRGLFSSHAAIPNANNVTIADYASDVHAWAKAIRDKTGAKCIWVLGHSEGALVAMVAAKDNPPDICGLLLVAAPGRKFGELIKDQMRSNPALAPFLDEALRDIDTLEAGKRVEVSVENTRPEIFAIFQPAVQDFLIDLMSYDPSQVLAAYKGRALILQGERDIQVSVDDARQLAEADRAAKLVLLPDVNHVLKTVTSDDKQANLKTYFDPKLPLAPGVVDDIADFISGKSP
ncbi:MAG TPA: alpha/beta fold hydrolase [Stellaceae bacterium]|nr:alpha/beta fold hydrolase [Stellaceae bacterium]